MKKNNKNKKADSFLLYSAHSTAKGDIWTKTIRRRTDAQATHIEENIPVVTC